MGRGSLAAGLVALALTGLGGCGGEMRWEEGRVLLGWEAHEMLFALSPQRARLDAYRLHGGVLWTGGVELPAQKCFRALRFDPDSARLWVFGEEGGVLVDARRMRLLASWDGAQPPTAPPPTALVAQADAGSADVCASPRIARHAPIRFGAPGAMVPAYVSQAR